MSVQPIGIATIVVGFACLLLGIRFSLIAFSTASLLAAAAALYLGSSGQVQPAHLLLVFVVPAILCHRLTFSAAVQSLVFPRPGFFLAFAALFGVTGAMLLPRIFADATTINAVGQTAAGPGVTRVPLGPVGGNLTQSIYFMADLACFIMVVGVSAFRDGTLFLGKAMLVFAALNVFFAFLDLGTYYTGTAFLLDPIRNAQYTLHLDEVTSGLKRIAGSFTETSSFSTATLGAIGFTGTLWLYGRWPTFTGTLTAVSIVLLFLSTSSTGLVGGVLMLTFLYLSALGRIGVGLESRLATAIVVAAPLVAVVALAAVLLNPSVSGGLSDYLNVLLFEKAASQSGVERASWNAAAFRNILDTDGLGAGLGSVRASSFLIALPANLGLPGAGLFSCFLWQALGRAGRNGGSDADFQIAARNACVGLLLAAAISGALVDLGLQFYFFAGIASSAARPVTRLIKPKRNAHRTCITARRESSV